ncbi:MAG: hypothetical protein WBD28_05315 [Candidatus Zixiibacteriota bacterium]
MKRRVHIILGFVLLILINCAFRQPGVGRYEISCKNIDHFLVENYEVGVLEFEPCILLGRYMPVYHFPVYLEGERKHDFYVNVYGSSRELDPFRFKNVSREFLYQQQFLWILEERIEQKPHKILKKYERSPTYNQIKEDVIAILSKKR